MKIEKGVVSNEGVVKMNFWGMSADMQRNAGHSGLEQGS